MKKIEVAYSHIENITKRMDVVADQIKREKVYLEQYLEKGDIHWVGVCARKMDEYVSEWEKLKAIHREMKELMDFITSKNE